MFETPTWINDSRALISGASVFDGQTRHTDAVLEVVDGRIGAVTDKKQFFGEPMYELPAGSLIVPGFVDLQVNGGGGVLFNNDTTVSAIRRICEAHRQFGTTAVLVTLITDTAERTEAAIAAGVAAYKQNVPGFAGLHLEGPHLSLKRKGTHFADLIRPMSEDDLQRLLGAARELPRLVVTLAPESVTRDQVRLLVHGGVVVSLGHSDTDIETAQAYAEAGATLVTHLFNAMSPLQHREPGLVGAALATDALSCGLIADGHHVHPVAIRLALAAKRKPGKIFLVTDAMSCVGTSEQQFVLNGRTIFRSEGRLALEDGTLAGADTDMLSSVLFMQNKVGLPLEEALRMASTYPADAGSLPGYGRLCAGDRADFLVLNERLEIVASVIAGQWLRHDGLAA